MIPHIFWAGVYVSGIAVDAQGTATIDFTAQCPKVRLDKEGRRSARYRLRYVHAQRVGPNTVGGGVIDSITVGDDTARASGIPFYSGQGPIDIDHDLCEWNPRQVVVVFTCRSSVSSSFQVAIAVVDLGPDPGYTPEPT